MKPLYNAIIARYVLRMPLFLYLGILAHSLRNNLCGVDVLENIDVTARKDNEEIYGYIGGYATCSILNAVVIRYCHFEGLGDSALCFVAPLINVSCYASLFINCASWERKMFSELPTVYYNTQAGGGIFAYVRGCEVIRTCAYKCEAEFGLAFFLVGFNWTRAIESSAVYCCGENAIWGQDTIRLVQGCQEMNGVNSTGNMVAEDGGAFECCHGDTVKLRYCTCTSNFGSSIISLYAMGWNEDPVKLNNGYLIYDDLQYVNVYNNSADATILGYSHGLIIFGGKIQLSNWVFKGNRVVARPYIIPDYQLTGIYPDIIRESRMIIENCTFDIEDITPSCEGVEFRTIYEVTDPATLAISYVLGCPDPIPATYEFTRGNQPPKSGKEKYLSFALQVFLFRAF